MYESPIKMICDQIRIERENGMLSAVQNCGFEVDKAELTKALLYDRKQYDKGFEDGAKAFAERLKSIVNNDIDRCYALGIGSVGHLCLFIDEINDLLEKMTDEGGEG